MNPQEQFCPKMNCEARGQLGKGNIVIHSRKERRYKCKQCNSTFTARKGSALYGLKKPAELFVVVITLLAYGCPIPAIVVAFNLDVRTVRSWLLRAGEHCQGVHEHVVQQHQMDLQQVQADEIKVKTQSGWYWIGSALQVTTRLWLGGAVSLKRDFHLAEQLAVQIRSMALCRKLLLAVDGWASYVRAFQNAFRTPLHTGKVGRPRLIAWQEVAIVQVIKKRSVNHFEITRRVVQGCTQMIAGLLQLTQTGGCINTAYIERLNATFRQRLDVLTRRTRTLARKQLTLQAGMYLVGCVYNFCTFHKSLRLPLYLSERKIHWVKRTPAIAAALTNHRWSVLELLSFKVPPPRWTLPKRRGRPSSATLELVQQWCS
ncbi:MAG: IS1 family transposase [Anaerolineales bacterium]|jgi:transposase-like protein|nr:IS1 family transposase [Anaerolineales bacterium]